MSSYKQATTPRTLNDSARAELEAYLVRIRARLTRELKKYGFSWEALESAYKLPPQAKQDLDDQWCTFYAGHGERPYRPNPCEFGEYLEYLRVEKRLEDPRVQMVSSAFGM